MTHRNFVIFFLGIILAVSCAKPPPAARPGAFNFFPPDDKGGFVDQVWLVNTAMANMAQKHLVEGGPKETVRIPILCALVRHGSEYFLIDTGLNHNFAFKPADYMGKFTFFIAKMVREMPTMSKGQDVVAQITRMGLIPEQITKIVLTHAHFDHTGELQAFPKAQVLIGPGETKFIQRAFGETHGVLKKDFSWDAIKELSFTDTKPFLTFTGSLDLFPDKSVTIVPTPGHTPGSISVYVRTKQAQFLFCGDAAYAPVNIEKPVNTGYNDNPPISWETIERLHDLHSAMPGLKIITFHDPAFADVPYDTPMPLVEETPKSPAPQK